MVTETSALVERHNIHTQNKTKEEVPAQNVKLSAAVCKQNHFFPRLLHSVYLSLLGHSSARNPSSTIYPGCIAKWLEMVSCSFHYICVYRYRYHLCTHRMEVRIALHEWIIWSAIYTHIL